MTPALRAILFNNPYRGIAVALGFVPGAPSVFNGVLYGAPTQLPGWSFTRASTGYAQTSSGLLVSFGSGVPRITDQGILIELAATNVALWCRDLTNAAWSKTNATAGLNLTGADGAANSASTLTATAGNATALQVVTLASSQRAQSAFVKRITGSGAVQMTTDGGTTWTAITLTANWTQVTISPQTVTNPSLGFRIVTSGDAIGVDFVQNETGAVFTSPILTTTASATRAADLAEVAGNFLPTSTWSVVVKTFPGFGVAAGALPRVFSISDGTAANVLEFFSNNTSASVQETVSSVVKFTTVVGSVTAAKFNAAVSSNSGTVTASVNGAASVAAGTFTPFTPTMLVVGARADVTRALNGYVQQITVLNYPINVQLASQ